MESSPTLEYDTARTYIRIIPEIMGYCGYSAIINVASETIPIPGITRTLQDIVAEHPQESDIVIPTDWLISVWNGWAVFYGDHVLTLSRRLGRAWWHPGGMCPLYPKDWDQDCLYKRVAPLVVDRCKTRLEETRNFKLEERVMVALETLAHYLQDNLHCEIAVLRLDETRFLFHILHNTLASDDDENYRVFYGILEEFCWWLRVSARVDEEASTYNKIVVVYPG